MSAEPAGLNERQRSVLLGRPSVGERELEAVRRVFESGWLSGAGPACSAFEQALASSSGTHSAVATANCGAALHLAIQVLGAGPGDEVIVADYTFPATAHAVVWAGASPVFADVLADTGNVDPRSVADLVTPRTVGIIAVDLVGLPADYDELRAVAERHSLWLLEDAACSVGATYRGRPAGSLADLAAFSFHGRKGITSGEGGALVGNDREKLELARRLHTYGIEPAVQRESSSQLAVPHFRQAGHNYRMSDIQAAIMTVQLERLPELLAARQEAAHGYAERLSTVEALTLPMVPDGYTSSWQSYLVTVNDRVDRDALVIALRQRGVGSNFGTYSCHLQPVYESSQRCPVSARLFRSQLALPMHAELDDDDLDWVAEALNDALDSDEVQSASRGKARSSM